MIEFIAGVFLIWIGIRIMLNLGNGPVEPKPRTFDYSEIDLAIEQSRKTCQDVQTRCQEIRTRLESQDEALRAGLELNEQLVTQAIDREERAKGALTVTMRQHGYSELQIQMVLDKIDKPEAGQN